MASIAKWDETGNPIITPDVDWNNLVDTLAKSTDYIVFLTGSQYRALNGTTGLLVYSGSTYATVKGSVTGSLTGTLFDRVSNCLEGYSAGLLQTQINLTGSYISGTKLSFTNLLATYITGSTTVSGSTLLGTSAVIPTINSTNIITSYVTGSATVSGSDIRGTSAVVPTISSVNITASNVTGSIIISGSNLLGTSAVVPTITSVNMNATNITGSGIVSGSNIKGTSATIVNVTSTNLTGSGTTVFQGVDTKFDIPTLNSWYGGEECASYIFFTGSGGIYCAKNASTGVIDYSGSDADTVVQNAMANITVDRGNLFFKAGLWYFNDTGSFYLTHAGNDQYQKMFNIIGEGHNTLFRFSHTTGSGITLCGDVHNLIIKDINIMLVGDDIIAIKTNEAYRTKIQNVNVYGSGPTHGQRGIVLTSGSHWNRVVACTLRALGHGIHLESGSNDYPNGNFITDCDFNNCKISIEVEGNANSIIAPKIDISEGAPDNSIGINLEQNSNQVFGGRIESGKLTNTTALAVASGCTNNKILSVYFTGWETKVSDLGTKTTKKYLSGYATENKGYITLTGQSGSFAHGIDAIPTIIEITSSGSASAGYFGGFTAWLSGSAGVWVVQTGSGTIGAYWRVEV